MMMKEGAGGGGESKHGKEVMFAIVAIIIFSSMFVQSQIYLLSSFLASENDKKYNCISCQMMLTLRHVHRNVELQLLLTTMTEIKTCEIDGFFYSID